MRGIAQEAGTSSSEEPNTAEATQAALVGLGLLVPFALPYAIYYMGVVMPLVLVTAGASIYVKILVSNYLATKNRIKELNPVQDDELKKLNTNTIECYFKMVVCAAVIAQFIFTYLSYPLFAATCGHFINLAFFGYVLYHAYSSWNDAEETTQKILCVVLYTTCIALIILSLYFPLPMGLLFSAMYLAYALKSYYPEKVKLITSNQYVKAIIDQTKGLRTRIDKHFAEAREKFISEYGSNLSQAEIQSLKYYIFISASAVKNFILEYSYVGVSFSKQLISKCNAYIHKMYEICLAKYKEFFETSNKENGSDEEQQVLLAAPGQS